MIATEYPFSLLSCLMRATTPWWYSCPPCARLRRATFMPPTASASSISLLSQAGPMVATSLVRRAERGPAGCGKAAAEEKFESFGCFGHGCAGGASLLAATGGTAESLESCGSSPLSASSRSREGGRCSCGSCAGRSWLGASSREATEPAEGAAEAEAAVPRSPACALAARGCAAAVTTLDTVRLPPRAPAAAESS